MSLTLSSRELALLGNALTIAAAPLAYARTSDWQLALRLAIESLLGADKSDSVVIVDGQPAMDSSADDMPAWRAYMEAHFADEQGDRRVGLRRGPEVAHVAMVHDVPRLRRSELYNEFVRPYAMFNAVSIQLFIGAADGPASMTFFHALERASPFGQRAVDILELVRPVFRSSVELMARPTGAPHRPAFAHLVDALPDAAALYSASGRLLHESPSLRRLLTSEPLAWRVRDAIAAAARALVGNGAVDIPKSGNAPIGAPVAFEVRGAQMRYAVRGSLVIAPAAAARDAARDAATIVFVSAAPPRAWSDAELRDRFALTAREVEVARLLAAGRSAREIAGTLGLSYFTVRHHIEHLLVKLGVRTRAAVGAALAAVGED